MGVAALLLAAWAFSGGHPFRGSLAVVAGLLFVLGALRHGTVWVAWQAFKRGYPDKARRYLRQTLWPALLDRSSRGYFEWLHGKLAAEEGNWQEAIEGCQRAQQFGLRTENDRCLLQCCLAEAYLNLDDLPSARRHLQLAEQTGHRLLVDETLARLKDAIAQREAETGRASQTAIE